MAPGPPPFPVAFIRFSLGESAGPDEDDDDDDEDEDDQNDDDDDDDNDDDNASIPVLAGRVVKTRLAHSILP